MYYWYTLQMTTNTSSVVKAIVSIIFVLVATWLLLFYNKPSQKKEALFELYKKTPQELGLASTEWGNYISLLPNQQKILVNGNNDTMLYLLDIYTGTTITLRGKPFLNSINDTHIISLEGSGIVHFYDLVSSMEHSLSFPGLVYTAVISPDNEYVALSTQYGIRIVSLKDYSVSELSKNNQDAALAWMSNVREILGYRQTKENLSEAGFGRVLVVWDITKKTYKDIAVDFPSSALRYIEWVVPDVLARVNAGFDDGSYDYTLDLENNFVADLGETSGMVPGGTTIDLDRKEFIAVGKEYSDINGKISIENVALKKNMKGTVVARVKFSDTDERKGVIPIDEDTIAYTKPVFSSDNKQWTSQVVLLSFSTAKEKILGTYPGEILSLVHLKEMQSLLFVTPKGLQKIRY